MLSQLRHPAGKLVFASSTEHCPVGYQTVLAQFALAVKLDAIPGLMLRALVEEWPLDRIVREVH